MRLKFTIAMIRSCSFRMAGIVLFQLVLLTASAQRDTLKKPQAIEIISAYKPILRSVVKINFSGTALPADSNRTVRAYQLPSQQLFYAYQAVPLKPLALENDTSIYLGQSNYAKLGIGNLQTLYAEAGVGFGDGRNRLLNIIGSFRNSKGKIRFQDYSEFSIKANGSYFLPGKEVYGSLGFQQRQQFFYGYNQQVFDFSKDQLRQQFQSINIKAGIRNTEPNELGIDYDPTIQVKFFANKDRNSESSFLIDLPVTKRWDEHINAGLHFRADLTNYASKELLPEDISFSNNVALLTAKVGYQKNSLNLTIGATASWDNSDFAFLPNIYGEWQLVENKFSIIGGWVGAINKNTMQNLTAINPFLSTLRSQTNTRETEFYGGVKAQIGNHFQFNAKAGFLTYRNYQFFVNDYRAGAEGKSFILSDESTMNNFRIKADMSYVNKEHFTINAGITLNGFTGVTDNEKAWHTVPMEINASLRWWILKPLLLKADCYIFGGGNYLEVGNLSRSFNGAADFSAGAEYKINRRFSAFLDINNIFGQNYQRWHNYPVYGINFLAGLVARF